jgi:hypothetical protein
MHKGESTERLPDLLTAWAVSPHKPMARVEAVSLLPQKSPALAKNDVMPLGPFPRHPIRMGFPLLGQRLECCRPRYRACESLPTGGLAARVPANGGGPGPPVLVSTSAEKTLSACARLGAKARAGLPYREDMLTTSPRPWA